MEELTSRALTATLAPTTPAKAVNIEMWAKWAKFNLNRSNPQERTQLEAMVAGMARFCQEVKSFCALDIPQDQPRPLPRWLSFIGSSGAGKTYLARAIWNWYRRLDSFRAETIRDEHSGRDEIRYPGQWCWWPGIGRQLANNEGYDLLQELEMERLVVFDELGADRDPSGHIRDCLARTLSARVGKWTVITSNKRMEDIENQIDARIASRMIRDGSEVIEVDVTDYSLRK